MVRGFTVETCAMDKGYDIERVYTECADRGTVPVIPLRQTPVVKRGDHKPPTCSPARSPGRAPFRSPRK